MIREIVIEAPEPAPRRKRKPKRTIEALVDDMFKTHMRDLNRSVSEKKRRTALNSPIKQLETTFEPVVQEFFYSPERQRTVVQKEPRRKIFAKLMRNDQETQLRDMREGMDRICKIREETRIMRLRSSMSKHK